MKILVRIIPPSKWKRNYLLDMLKKNKLDEMKFPTNFNFLKELINADIIISNCLTKKNLRFAKKLKFLIIPTSGRENIAIKEAKKMGILIIQNKEIIHNSVSRYLLDNLKKIIKQPLKKFLNGKKVGILGFGSLGIKLFNCLSRYNCHFLIIKRKNIKITKKKYKLDFISGLNRIDYILKNSDIIINTLPLNEKTKDILKNKTTLLKKDCIIVNLSRSGVIDENEILKLVEKAKIKGIISDVYSDKIKASKYKNKNIILTSHIAGLYGNGLNNLIKFILKEVKNIIARDLKNN
jgi:phosphoglycerate dehydrogenase-like enzyme